jgi:Holliday junction resolvasome RuvABC endonuclease subunit
MNKTIIAIDPGTRYWGVTIFQDTHINLSIVKTLSVKGSVKHRAAEAKLAFLSIFDKYVPDILVIEKPLPHWIKQSKVLFRIIDELKTSAKQRGIKVCGYSPKTVKEVVCGDENAGKREIAEAICLIYPEMKPFLKQDNQYQEISRGHMFDSVALGLCHLRKSELLTNFSTDF